MKLALSSCDQDKLRPDLESEIDRSWLLCVVRQRYDEREGRREREAGGRIWTHYNTIKHYNIHVQ